MVGKARRFFTSTRSPSTRSSKECSYGISSGVDDYEDAVYSDTVHILDLEPRDEAAEVHQRYSIIKTIQKLLAGDDQ